MSIFAKKPEKNEPKQPELKHNADLTTDVEVERTQTSAPAPSGYGIADAIRLMRSLPVDQNIDLIVRVVRVTLSSVNVRIEDIVDDANRRQQAIQDHIASLHEKVADLEEQLEARRRDIAAQEADYKETTSVKERLLLAEKSANFAQAQQQRATGTDSAQPPQPPPPPPARMSLPKPAPRE